jgi:hypothetical protein
MLLNYIEISADSQEELSSASTTVPAVVPENEEKPDKCGGDQESSNQKESSFTGLWKKFGFGGAATSKPKKRKTGEENEAVELDAPVMMEVIVAAQAMHNMQEVEAEVEAEAEAEAEAEVETEAMEMEMDEEIDGVVVGGGESGRRSLEMIKEEQEDEVKVQYAMQRKQKQ